MSFLINSKVSACPKVSWYLYYQQFAGKDLTLKKNMALDLPGGAVVKNPPANAGDTGSSPGLVGSHMPWSN